MNNQEVYNRKRNRILAGIVISIILIIGIIIALLSTGAKSNLDTQKGRNFIQQEENRDPYKTEKQLFAREFLEQFDGLNTWQKLDRIDIALVGDSRVAMFLNREEFNPSYVLADKSTTIRNIPDYIWDLRDLHPNYIMISYGMNDLGMYQFDPDNYWETADEYVEEYKVYIDQILELLPDAKICICAILPVTYEALEMQSRWALVDEWNETLKEFCEENNYIYIDAATTAYEHPDLYDIDGVHFLLPFYPYWADAIWEGIEGSIQEGIEQIDIKNED